MRKKNKEGERTNTNTTLIREKKKKEAKKSRLLTAFLLNSEISKEVTRNHTRAHTSIMQTRTKQCKYEKEKETGSGKQKIYENVYFKEKATTTTTKK